MSTRQKTKEFKTRKFKSKKKKTFLRKLASHHFIEADEGQAFFARTSPSMEKGIQALRGENINIHYVNQTEEHTIGFGNE